MLRVGDLVSFEVDGQYLIGKVSGFIGSNCLVFVERARQSFRIDPRMLSRPVSVYTDMRESC